MLMQPVTKEQLAEYNATKEDILVPYIIEWDSDRIDQYYTDVLARIIAREMQEQSR